MSAGKPRLKAKAAGETRYYTGVPCPAGHVAERLVSNYSCVECLRIARLERYYAVGAASERKREGVPPEATTACPTTT